MGTALVNYVLNLWPFSGLGLDDLKLSDRLVRKLSLPEHTKQFVFAIREPQNGSVVYILSAQNLSERSAWDVEFLIREVQPDSVVALVGQSTLSEINEHQLAEAMGDQVPTSAFGVLTRSFINKTNKATYEDLAGNLVLKEIFGVGFYGHFFAAKKLAEEIGSSFCVIESPIMKSVEADTENDTSSQKNSITNKLQSLALQPASLVPQNLGPLVSNSRRLFINNDVQSHMVKLLSPVLSHSILKVNPSSSLNEGSCLIEPRCNYNPPPFAQTVYPLLMDLHDIFSDIPSMGRALAYAQKMFSNVGTGDIIDTDLLSEVYTFRIAVEGLRVALNNTGRLPISKSGKSSPNNIDFQKLSVEEKSHCLLAQTLRNEAKKHKRVVAVVDASSLAGLRKFWNTSLPCEVMDMVEELISQDTDGESINDKKKHLLSGKPVVAVASSATAFWGASSLSKTIPVTSVVKVVVSHIPASLKLFFTQTHKATLFAVSKVVGPSKIVGPGLASSGAKASTSMKAAASAEKIRAITHSIIASAEKTSFSTMRAAFYEIMRKRRAQPIRSMPWATFGISVVSCSGLLVYGDGIECAAESLPAAPSIASLGRGIQNLQQASQSIGHSCGHKIQKAIESLMYNFKKVKIQE